MKAAKIFALVILLTLFRSTSAFALSTPIGRDINFPTGYDPEKATAIRCINRCERSFSRAVNETISGSCKL